MRKKLLVAALCGALLAVQPATATSKRERHPVASAPSPESEGVFRLFLRLLGIDVPPLPAPPPAPPAVTNDDPPPGDCPEGENCARGHTPVGG